MGIFKMDHLNSFGLIKREEIEIISHLKIAEGCHLTKPTKEEIKRTMEHFGYKVDNIDMSYDNMQQLWRWTCDLFES